MTAEEVLLDNGYKDVKYLVNYSYNTVLMGVSECNRAIYDYDLMVEWLIINESMSYDDAYEWIDYNTIRALQYMGEDCPIIIHRFI